MRTAVSGMPPGLWHTVALRQQRYKKTFTNNRKYEYFQSRHIKTYRFCPEGVSEGLREGFGGTSARVRIFNLNLRFQERENGDVSE